MTNPKLKEITKIIKYTQFRYKQKYGSKFYRKVNVNCNVNYFDKRKNERKNIIIECNIVLGEMKKEMKSSAGFIKFIGAIELIIIIKGRIHKNNRNGFLRYDNIHILWRKHFVRIANDRECKSNRFIPHCRERHF